MTLMAFVKRIPYRVRAGSWVILFYLLGVVNLALNGFNVDAGLFLLAFVLMAGLFFDQKQWLVALGVSVATIAIFGYIVVRAHIIPVMDLPQTAPLLWIIGGMIFIILGMLLVFPLSVLMGGLVGYLNRAEDESEELRKTNQALRSSEERYRSLVEISPDLVTLIDLDGKIIVANPPGLSLI